MCPGLADSGAFEADDNPPPAGSSTPELFHKAAMPAAVEIRGEMLYGTTRVLAEDKPGKLVVCALRASGGTRV